MSDRMPSGGGSLEASVEKRESERKLIREAWNTAFDESGQDGAKFQDRLRALIGSVGGSVRFVDGGPLIVVMLPENHFICVSPEANKKSVQLRQLFECKDVQIHAWAYRLKEAARIHHKIGTIQSVDDIDPHSIERGGLESVV